MKQKETKQAENNNNKKVKQEHVVQPNRATDGINLDYDWNTEYGDGDIPDVDQL